MDIKKSKSRRTSLVSRRTSLVSPRDAQKKKLMLTTCVFDLLALRALPIIFSRRLFVRVGRSNHVCKGRGGLLLFDVVKQGVNYVHIVGDRCHGNLLL